MFISAAIGSLLYLTPFQDQCKFLYTLKRELVQKVHAQLYSTFLYSSIIITQLLSAGLKRRLHLLAVSEMGKFHTVALNFDS